MKRSYLLIPMIIPILFSPFFGCEVSPPNNTTPQPNSNGFSTIKPLESERMETSNEPTELPKTDVIVHLPFAPWTTIVCPYWMNELESNQPYTKHDVAFPITTETTELYSPVSGLLYVHNESNSPFGKHVTVDNSDGTYVVLGGFTSITAKNFHVVSMGQLIGYKSGDCDTSINVYLGIHSGSATLPAENGISIPTLYRAYTADPYIGTLYESKWLVCDQNSNESNTTPFDSGLPMILQHPDGTLVQTPNVPKIYLLTNGKRKEIMNQNILESHGYFLDDVVMISNAEMNCVSEDQPIDELGFVEAVTDLENAIWLLVGKKTDWNRYRILIQETSWEGVLDSWGLPFYTEWNPPPFAEDTENQLTDWPIKKGFAHFRRGTLLKEISSSKLYVITNDVAMNIQDSETFLLLGYDQNNIVIVEDGSLKTIQKTIGNCEQNNNCLTYSSVMNCKN